MGPRTSGRSCTVKRNFRIYAPFASRLWGKHSAVLSSATLQCAEAASRNIFSRTTGYRFHDLVSTSTSFVILCWKTETVRPSLHMALNSASLKCFCSSSHFRRSTRGDTFILVATARDKAAQPRTVLIFFYGLCRYTTCRKRVTLTETATLVLLHFPEAIASKAETGSTSGARNAYIEYAKTKTLSGQKQTIWPPAISFRLQVVLQSANTPPAKINRGELTALIEENFFQGRSHAEKRSFQKE